MLRDAYQSSLQPDATMCDAGKSTLMGHLLFEIGEVPLLAISYVVY